MDSMAGLYISDQLLDGSTSFSHLILIVAEPLDWLAFKNSSRSGGHSQGMSFCCPSG